MGHEPDEDGLPPLDVPDDARDLAREVQAYRRELRWRRRRERLRGIARTARRYGPVPPLVAGVLLLASISAALLMLGVRLNGQPAPPESPDSPPATRGAVPAGALGEAQWHPHVLEDPSGTLSRRSSGSGVTAVFADRRGVGTAVVDHGYRDTTPAGPATRSALALLA